MQACKVVTMQSLSSQNDELLLRSGDRARVTFEFLYRPEYLVIGSRMVFREGRTKGIGQVRPPL